jgi:hypothetical protein
MAWDDGLVFGLFPACLKNGGDIGPAYVNHPSYNTNLGLSFASNSGKPKSYYSDGALIFPDDSSIITSTYKIQDICAADWSMTFWVDLEKTFFTTPPTYPLMDDRCMLQQYKIGGATISFDIASMISDAVVYTYVSAFMTNSSGTPIASTMSVLNLGELLDTDLVKHFFAITFNKATGFLEYPLMAQTILILLLLPLTREAEKQLTKH